MKKRREYSVRLIVNGRRISKVIIDPHYELKHSSSVNDALIVRLVENLDGGQFDPDEKAEGFEYYVSDGLEFEGKRYKLIWLLEDHEIYIGVVNAYRRR